MQLLEIPITQTPMTIGLSIKGVTHLTESRYKRRHSGSKEILQQPVTGLIHRKRYYTLFPHEKPTAGKGRSRRARPGPPPPPPPPQKISESGTNGSEPPSRVFDDSICSASVSKLTTQNNAPKKVREYSIDKKQVSHRILNYVNSMKGEKQLYFWTITFKQGIDDAAAYKILNKWLTRMRQDAHLKSYLWIAERQQNNTIHYHIAIHQKIPVVKANKFMRACLMRSADANEITMTRTDIAKYNGVDIAKNRKTRRVTNFAQKKHQKTLTNYLTKYVSKSESRFPHLAWHNSRDYSNLIISVNVTASEFFNSDLKNYVCLDSGKEGDYYVHFRWKGEPPQKLLDYLAMANQMALAELFVTVPAAC